MNTTIRKITSAAMFIGILIVFQLSTAMMGQFVTGSLVNLTLIAATLIGGLWVGLVVAVLSPIFAFFLGIGPKFIQLLPFVMLGNAVLVLTYGLLIREAKKIKGWPLAIGVGALIKFGVLYFGIVKVALPMAPGIAEKQVAALSATFSWPQLVTAGIGGILAGLIVPAVLKAVKKNK